MSGKMQLTAKLDQRLAMSQQLRQAITMLQYNTIELKQYIQQALEQNPLIEIDETLHEQHDDESDYYTPSSMYAKRKIYDGDESIIENVAARKSLRDHLYEQTLLCKFTADHQMIAEAIIDAIDDNGLLTMTVDEIAIMLGEDMAVTVTRDDIEDVLQEIQHFDPVGVAARNMKECLTIQIDKNLPRCELTEIAKKIIDYSFESNAINNANKIIKKLGISESNFIDAMNIIKKLDPNPGRQYSTDNNINIEPEIYVKKIKNKWRAFLADSLLTHLKINKEYQILIKQSKRETGQNTLAKELQEAQWLLKGLQRRNETLMKVASCIVEVQHDFFERGPEALKPLTNADIAQMVDMHESTISRVTSGKYIATPHGVYELKYFFPTHLANQEGSICSDAAVKQLIQQIVSQETGDKIYSDSDIARLLKEMGVQIARRTVAKYREALNILPSYQRAKLQFDIS